MDMISAAQFEQMESDVLQWARMLTDLQNENPMPMTGTMGFILGMGLALGNAAAVYSTGLARNERRRFLQLVLDTVADAYKSPMVTGEVMDGGAVH